MQCTLTIFPGVGHLPVPSHRIVLVNPIFGVVQLSVAVCQLFLLRMIKVLRVALSAKAFPCIVVGGRGRWN